MLVCEPLCFRILRLPGEMRRRKSEHRTQNEVTGQSDGKEAEGDIST